MPALQYSFVVLLDLFDISGSSFVHWLAIYLTVAVFCSFTGSPMVGVVEECPRGHGLLQLFCGPSSCQQSRTPSWIFSS